MEYLITVNECHYVDTQREVDEMIEKAKNSDLFALKKYTSELKQIKSKGEVIDTYYKVTLTKAFNDIKDPTTPIYVSYLLEEPNNGEAPF